MMGDDTPKTRRSKRDYSSHVDWSQEMNFDVYKCYLKAREDPSLGYMVRLKTYWDKLHPELTIFNAKQLRQQATFVETKMDFNIDGKSPHLKLDAIISELKMDVYDTNGGKRNGSGEPLGVLQQLKNAENMFGRRPPGRFEVNNNGCHVNGDGKPLPYSPKNSRKGGKHYYEPVMTTGAPVKHLYREAMEQVHTYNSKLLLERRLRMPYIDNQTGLAQQDCHLWVSRVQRCAPIKEGQIYSYPSRRWMVRKRPDFIGSSKLEKKNAADGEDVGEGIQDEKTATLKGDDNSMDGSLHTPVTTYEDYYDEDAFDSELDSDEEFGSRKKKRKTGRGSGRSNKRSSMALKFGERVGGRAQSAEMTRIDNKTKVYECQICNKRYKNSQSLRYHYEHYNHHNNTENQQNNNVQNNGSGGATTTNPEVPATQPVTEQPPADHVTGAKRKKGMPPSCYCDFCLGSAEMNKKSGSAEEMISCADCGRSGHPSCLQFNENLTGQCKKYKWQCIECKCCCLCGTSDNDEQLLFCDDCDRGYHMYCLNPPIDEPPEGSWQCQLCEARVKGEDITQVSVLSQHMDFGKGPALPTPAPATNNTSDASSAENGTGQVSSAASISSDSSPSSTNANTAHPVSQPNGHGPLSGLSPGHPNAHPFAQRSMHGGPPRGGSHSQMHSNPHMSPYGSQHPPPYHPQYGSQYGSQYPPQYGSPYGAPPPYGYPGPHHGPPNSQHRGIDPSQRPPQYGSQPGGPQYPPHGMRHPLHPIAQHPSQRPPLHLGGPRSSAHGEPQLPASHLQHRPPFGAALLPHGNLNPYPNNISHSEGAINGTPPAQHAHQQQSGAVANSALKQPVSAPSSTPKTTAESQQQQQQHGTQPPLLTPTSTAVSATIETPNTNDNVPTTKPDDGPASAKESYSLPPPASSE